MLNRPITPDFSTLSMIDTVTGDDRVFYAVPEALSGAQVSPDGKHLLYTSQRIQENVFEVGVTDGRVRTMPVARGRQPEWAPDGTRYLFATERGIEEAATSERFSRPLVTAGEQTALNQPRWSPDGTQFILTLYQERTQLMLANASGRMLPLDPQASGNTSSGIWTRDGHVIYTRTFAGQRAEVARIRPGSAAPPEILAQYPSGDPRRRTPIAMSPDGKGILAAAVGPKRQLFLVAPDFSRERALPSERLESGSAGFSKDGREVMSIGRSTRAEGAVWQLWAVDIATGRERLVTGIDLPDATSLVRGFSLHPDGTRFLTSTYSSPADIWMLSGFDRK